MAIESSLEFAEARLHPVACYMSVLVTMVAPRSALQLVMGSLHTVCSLCDPVLDSLLLLRVLDPRPVVFGGELAGLRQS